MTDIEQPDWLNTPETINPYSYVDEMAVLMYPQDEVWYAHKKTRKLLKYQIERGKLVLAKAPHPPYPKNHIFTPAFFWWLVCEYPEIKFPFVHKCFYAKPSYTPVKIDLDTEKYRELTARIAKLTQEKQETERQIQELKERLFQTEQIE